MTTVVKEHAKRVFFDQLDNILNLKQRPRLQAPRDRKYRGKQKQTREHKRRRMAPAVREQISPKSAGPGAAQAQLQARTQEREQTHAQAHAQAHAQEQAQAHAQDQAQAQAQTKVQVHTQPQRQPKAHIEAQSRSQAHENLDMAQNARYNDQVRNHGRHTAPGCGDCDHGRHPPCAFFSERTARAWTGTPLALLLHLRRLMQDRAELSDSAPSQESCRHSHVDANSRSTANALSVQTKYDGHRLHVTVSGDEGRVRDAVALSRTAKLLVSGAAAKWQRVRQAMLQDMALGAALQDLAEALVLGSRHQRGSAEKQGRAQQHTKRPSRCVAFQFTFDCELCTGLERRQFAQMHRAVSSTTVTSAVLVVFDIYSESHTVNGEYRRWHCAWYDHTLDRRLHRLYEIEHAVQAAGAGLFERTALSATGVACLPGVSTGCRPGSACLARGCYLAWAQRHCTQSASRALSLFLQACEAGEEGVLVKPMWGTWACTQDIKLKEGLLAPRDASPYRYRYRFCYRQRPRKRNSAHFDDSSEPRAGTVPAMGKYSCFVEPPKLHRLGPRRVPGAGNGEADHAQGGRARGRGMRYTTEDGFVLDFDDYSARGATCEQSGALRRGAAPSAAGANPSASVGVSVAHPQLGADTLARLRSKEIRESARIAWADMLSEYRLRQHQRRQGSALSALGHRHTSSRYGQLSCS